MENENLSRLEQYLQAIADGTGAEGLPEPQSRLEEIFRAIATGDDSHCPQPQSRLEAYALACVGAGGGTATPLQEKSVTITENGTTEVLPDEGYALSKVTAEVSVSGDGNDLVKEIAERTITKASSPNATTVGAYAFSYCRNLASVDFPNATISGDYAFDECRALTSVNLPNTTKLGMYSFHYCMALTSVDFPKVISVGSHSFYGCIALASVNLPNVNAIGGGAFHGCSNLASISLPNVTSIPSSVFENCTALSSVDFPKATSIEGSFRSCTALTYVDFPNVTIIKGMSFYRCRMLETVMLRSTEICTLPYNNSFDSTPFASNGTGGICLVPRALIETYQTATNWSALYAGGTCLFWALEDYTVDGTTTGEINWDKLNADREGAFA